MGQRAAECGAGVILSSYVIEHRIGSHGWRTNFAHRLRWARSTRRSRPAGYVGQLFTNPIPLALLLVGVRPAWWPLLIHRRAAIRSGIRHGAPRAARYGVHSRLVVDSAPGCAQLCFVGSRILWQYNRMARTNISIEERRAFRAARRERTQMNSKVQNSDTNFLLNNLRTEENFTRI